MGSSVSFFHSHPDLNVNGEMGIKVIEEKERESKERRNSYGEEE